MADEMLRLLRLLAGPEADLREGQREAIELLVSGGKVLVVQRTGWGKSAVYFIGARILRERGDGPVLVLSPLLVLMRNQIEAARKLDLAAVTVNSSQSAEERGQAVEAAPTADVIFVTPETLQAGWFGRDVLSRLERDPSAVVIDEVHCISEWGHNFRPKYRRIKEFLAQLPSGIGIVGTTATANGRAVDDIVEQLGDELEVIRGPLARESLELHVLPTWSQPKRLAWLADFVPAQSGAGIVYTLTVHDAERVARWLVHAGIDAVAYTGRMPDEDRRDVERRLIADEVEAVVATSALGMGYDKPGLTWVVHYQTAAGPIAYYQQVGRAGRGVEHALGIMLRGGEDADVHRWFIETAYPPEALARAVLAVVEGVDTGARITDILAEVNIRRSRLEAALVILEDDGVIVRDGGRFYRTPKRYQYPHARVEAVAEHRRRELAELLAYCEGDDCHMRVLQAALDDPAPAVCGRCGPCTGRSPEVDPDPALIAAAAEFLWEQSSVLQARKQWAPGAGLEVTGRIDEPLRAREGRVLGRYQDGGYGDLALDDRASGMPSSKLLEGVTGLYRRWSPEPTPTWVTWVPSNRHGPFLERLARRVADALVLPLREVLSKAPDAERQQTRMNSQQAARNAWQYISLTGEPLPGPVLVLDDVINTGWTLTVAAYHLLRAGSGAVHPIVLCELTSGDT